MLKKITANNQIKLKRLLLKLNQGEDADDDSCCLVAPTKEN